MPSWVVSLGLDVIQQAAVAATTFVVGYFWLRVGNRSRFRYQNPSVVTVIVSASAHTMTGTYRRSSTGIGQVRALAVINRRFNTAYGRKLLDQVFTSDAELAGRIEHDLLVLGGPKTNKVAADIIAQVQADQPDFPLAPVRDSVAVWDGKEYASVGDGTQLSRDHGYVVRVRNPFAPANSRANVLIFGGASTCGGHAAARVFVTDRWFRRRGDYAALVECQVRDGFPTRVRVIARAVRGRGGRWERL